MGESGWMVMGLFSSVWVSGSTLPDKERKD